MRQPQDFVRGRVDPQNVPEPRPLSPNRFISTDIILPNLIKKSDEQAIGWTGTRNSSVLISGSQPLSVLKMLGTSINTGIYEIAAGNIVDAGSVKHLQVQFNMTYLGLPNESIALPSSLQGSQTAYVFARVEIAIANKVNEFGDWMPAANIIYVARFVKFRILLSSFDIGTAVFITQFSTQVGIV